MNFCAVCSFVLMEPKPEHLTVINVSNVITLLSSFQAAYTWFT